VKRRDLERHLKQAGCALDREGANHSWWTNADGSRKSALPRHREIKPPVVRAICRQLGVRVPPNVN
jgi:hypothetical protein